MNKSSEITDASKRKKRIDLERAEDKSANISETGTNNYIKARRISSNKSRPTKNSGRVGNIIREMKKSAEELISETSLHGFVKISGANKHLLQRIIWAILALTSYSCFIKYIATNVEDYYQYPVITNINQVNEKEPEFPMIIICKANVDYCKFNNQICENVIYLGSCVQINQGKNVSYHEIPILRAVKPGSSNGLKLKLTPRNYDITLYINNQSVRYNPDKGIKLAIGMETSLVISRVFTSKLSYPYSNCKTGYTFDLGSEDHYNRSLYPYFQSECFLLCSIQKFFEAINKTEEYFQNFQYFFTNHNKWAYSTGANYNQSQSIYPEIYRYISDKYETLGKNKFCEDICPIECNSISYTITPYDRTNSNPYATVYIYYEDFTYTAITEIPKITPDNLFGNIGGILGLFLGASLLSVFEIVEFILIILCKFIKLSLNL